MKIKRRDKQRGRGSARLISYSHSGAFLSNRKRTPPEEKGTFFQALHGGSHPQIEVVFFFNRSKIYPSIFYIFLKEKKKKMKTEG